MNYIQEYIPYLLSVIFGALSIYFTAYTKEKGKYKALKQEFSKLEEEKQKIISKHRNETEELKKSHQLDIEKRKYQYESKQKLYFEFMNKLDHYNSLQFDLIFDELGIVMMSFYQAETEKEKKKFTGEYNDKCREIDTKIKKQSSELFSQLNQLRLTTNQNTTVILTELQDELQKLSEGFPRMTKFIESQNFQYMNKSPKIKEDDETANIKITSIKNRLISALKQELDEI